MSGTMPAPEASTPAPAVRLSQRLREETRAIHEQVESGATFNRLVVVRLPAPDPAAPAPERARRERALAEYRDVYRRFLVAAHGFEAAVDAALAAPAARALALAHGLPSEPEPPLPRLRGDVVHLYGDAAAAALPVMPGLPAITSLPQLAGTEYVRRGSRAGGAVIGAVVRHNLGLEPATGAAFLLAYGARTRAVIDAFRAWADGLALSGREADAAIAAAGATFAAVGAWHRHCDRD